MFILYQMPTISSKYATVATVATCMHYFWAAWGLVKCKLYIIHFYIFITLATITMWHIQLECLKVKSNRLNSETVVQNERLAVRCSERRVWWWLLPDGRTDWWLVRECCTPRCLQGPFRLIPTQTTAGWNNPSVCRRQQQLKTQHVVQPQLKTVSISKMPSVPRFVYTSFGPAA